MAHTDIALNGGPHNENKLRHEDSAAHDWYRFVLSFPPHLVRDYIERFGLGSGKEFWTPSAEPARH